MRLVLAAAVLAAACRSVPPAAPMRLVRGEHAGQRTLAVIPSREARINARVPPALELSGGSVLRLSNGRVSSDSAYFLEPPWQIDPGLRAVSGALRVSYCRLDEALCRTAVLPVELP
jgi:hypothetical protein